MPARRHRDHDRRRSRRTRSGTSGSAASAVQLEREIEARTGFETRMTILGHVQRGGTPTAYDRVLATRFGVGAVEAVSEGKFGTMVALRGTEIVLVGLEEAVAAPKLLDPGLYATAEIFFG